MAVASDSVSVGVNALQLSGTFLRLAFFRVGVASALAVSLTAVVGAERQTLASRDDAFIGHDAGAHEWTIGSGGLELTIGFNSQGALSWKKLWHPESGRGYLVSADSQAGVTLNDQEVALQENGTRSTLTGFAAIETDAGVQLSLTFEHRPSHTRITRAFAAYPQSPTIEIWTEVDAAASTAAIRISHLVGWQLTMPNAQLKWINGLRGSNSSDVEPQEASFSIQTGLVEDGGHLEIGSERRSSEAFVPLLFVEGADETLYGGVIWSGGWRISADRTGDSLSVRADFPNIVIAATTVQPVEFPHAFVGVTDPVPGAGTRALRQFVVRGLRKGRPFQPLVTYNTWFPYGSRIDDAVITAEIERAASLGVELFVLDAGWYEGAGTEDMHDYTSGLGSWKVDRSRFRDGLRSMADYARKLGMKFGLWVEPERVALSTIGQPGLAHEQWLATQGGVYGDVRSAQLCLASDAARRWVFDKLIELLDDVRPDYLKWDNNFWVNCDREGHDHGHDDGNYAHVVALYGLLAELKQRYPHMLIENVSGGGNRMDFGMLAYSDVGWMDDRTHPSDHVRHDFEGLAVAFPPAYLLSFIIDSSPEPLGGGADFPHIARSRMPGILGMTYRHQQLDPELSGALRLAITQYKELRETLQGAYALLLSAQAPVGEGWDVVEEVTEDNRAAVIFAFKGPGGAVSTLVRPRYLSPEATYEVSSPDSGNIGRISGARLMLDGLDVGHLEGTHAYILLLRQLP